MAPPWRVLSFADVNQFPVMFAASLTDTALLLKATNIILPDGKASVPIIQGRQHANLSNRIVQR